MARVNFTQNIQRHIQVPPLTVPGGTIREVLDAVFEQHPRARSYVLDEAGAIRKHMVIFVGGRQLDDPVHLTDAVPEDADVYVMQALSGG